MHWHTNWEAHGQEEPETPAIGQGVLESMHSGHNMQKNFDPATGISEKSGTWVPWANFQRYPYLQDRH